MDPLLYAKYLGALAVVMGLIAVVSFLAKHLPGAGGNRNSRGGRLQVIDQLAIDQKRRVVIIRQDEQEHLLLLGQPGDLHLETMDGPAPPDDQPRAEPRLDDAEDEEGYDPHAPRPGGETVISLTRLGQR